MTSVDDQEFIERFEACALPAESFHHQDHVRVVWLYLRRYHVLDTLARFTEGLRRFADAHGKVNLYHETITWAYVFLIHERMKRNGHEQNWTDFVEMNADLFDWKNSVLKGYYCDETLRSDFARRIFVFPDRFSAAAVTEQRPGD